MNDEKNCIFCRNAEVICGGIYACRYRPAFSYTDEDAKKCSWYSDKRIITPEEGEQMLRVFTMKEVKNHTFVLSDDSYYIGPYEPWIPTEDAFQMPKKHHTKHSKRKRK